MQAIYTQRNSKSKIATAHIFLKNIYANFKNNKSVVINAKILKTTYITIL